jgi:TM2 domain-containing membrane protein YozV
MDIMSKPGTAAVLSLLIPGVGQIYNGAFWRGIFWLIITPGFWIGSGGTLGWVGASSRPIRLIHMRKRQRL